MLEEMILSYLPAPFDSVYVVAAIIFVVFVLLSKLFVYIIEKIVLALTMKTKTKLDDMLVERTNKPISWLLVFIGFKIAFEYLGFTNGFAVALDRTIISLIYIAIGVVIVSVVVTIIDYWGIKVAKKTKSTIDDALVPLFRKTTKVILLIVIAITVLNLWGINVAGLLAGVGIAGIAIGFAVKDSLSNIFGGISLILDKTLNVGDKVELDDGTVGIVQDVGIRATRIRTYGNEVITIPNGSMSTMRLKNYNQPDMTARVVVPFGIEYGADPEKAKKIVVDEIKKIKDIMKEPAPSARFAEMGDSSLNMKVYFWVDDISKVFPKKEEAVTRIYNVLNKHKIGIPFPTRTVYVKK